MQASLSLELASLALYTSLEFESARVDLRLPNFGAPFQRQDFLTLTNKVGHFRSDKVPARGRDIDFLPLDQHLCALKATSNAIMMNDLLCLLAK